MISESELLGIYRSGDTAFFRPAEKYLSLPVPPKSAILPSESSELTIQYSASNSNLSEAFGVLIASRPDAFPTEKVQKGEVFNPTTLTAKIAQAYLQNLRNIICSNEIKSTGEKSKTQVAAEKLGASLATGGLVIAPQGVLVALAAFLLLIMLKATQNTFCELSDEEAIAKLINPNRKLRKTSEGSVRGSVVTEGSRPKLILVIIGILFVCLITFVVILG